MEVKQHGELVEGATKILILSSGTCDFKVRFHHEVHVHASTNNFEAISKLILKLSKLKKNTKFPFG